MDDIMFLFGCAILTVVLLLNSNDNIERRNVTRRIASGLD